MYQLDSNYQWKPSIVSEQKVVTLPWQPEKSIGENTNELALVKQRINVVTETADRSETETANNSVKATNDRQLEQLLGNLLNCGVLLASAIVFVGGVFYLIRHGLEPADYHVFRGEPTEFRFPTAVVAGALSGNRESIIALGILVSIATPIARVATSLLYFLSQRNLPYTIVTFLVISALLYGIIGAYC